MWRLKNIKLNNRRLRLKGGGTGNEKDYNNGIVSRSIVPWVVKGKEGVYR